MTMIQTASGDKSFGTKHAHKQHRGLKETAHQAGTPDARTCTRFSLFSRITN